MVATGQTTKFASVVPTEIIDVLNPTKSCVLEDKIIDHYQYGGTGGMFGTTPVICGGTKGTDYCLLYGTSQKIIMNSKRYHHSSIGLNNSMLWITGGRTVQHSISINSTEFVTTEGAVSYIFFFKNSEGKNVSCSIIQTISS